MRKNGQALVEFIIILPVIIMLLLGIIDFGMIFYKKNYLESSLDEITEIYKKTKDESKINDYLNKSKEDIKYNISYDNEYTTIILEQKYNFITPGLNLIITNPYEIEVTRVIYDE